MGHRFEALSLPPDLAVWREAGLELVLRDLLPAPAGQPGRASPDLPPAGIAEPAPAATPATNATAAKAQVLAKAILGARPVPASPAAGLHPGADLTLPHVPRGDLRGDPMPEGQGRSSPDSMAGESSPSSAGNRHQAWSGPFAVARTRLKPMARILWTYWELALDFGGDPNDARRSLCASIIKHLPYKDLIGFWPLSERQGATLLARAALFWQGAREIGATHVLCFGRQACMTLFPGRPYTCGVFSHGQISVVILPGFGDMLPDDRQLKAQAWSLLKDLPV